MTKNLSCVKMVLFLKYPVMASLAITKAHSIKTSLLRNFNINAIT